MDHSFLVRLPEQPAMGGLAAWINLFVAPGRRSPTLDDAPSSEKHHKGALMDMRAFRRVAFPDREMSPVQTG
jgi:hypothetical protein